jgi:diaminopimelate decarboxylase
MVRVQHEIQGIGMSEIAARYGTPFYVYDGENIKRHYQRLRKCLPECLEIFYSLKANPNISICALLKSLGARAEVSSLAELMCALKAGTDPRNIIFLGPGKRMEELQACLEHRIYAVVAESLQELELLDKICAERKSGMRVAIRINPSFEVKGARLMMGGRPRQFGIDQDQLEQASAFLASLKNISIIGFHTYMGTRILDEEEVAHNTLNILTMAENLARLLKIELEMVDIGGGLGVPYYDGETSIDPVALGERIAPHIQAFHERHPETRIIMELGRYLVAESGLFVARVLYTKESCGEHFVITDGGTNCHMAAVGIGSFVKRNFPIRNLSNTAGSEKLTCNITGPLCTPSDLLAKAVTIPKAEPGDLIGIENSGAYGPSASPVFFLSHGYPAEVMVLNGEVHLIRERDTYSGILDRMRLIPL